MAVCGWDRLSILVVAGGLVVGRLVHVRLVLLVAALVVRTRHWLTILASSALLVK